jgi:bacillithiol system protein YtxJ
VRDTILQLRDESELDEILKAPKVVIYKHSNRCGISRNSLLEVRHFADTHPAVPVYIVDVVAQKPLARAIADRLGIRHASPQTIVLREGRPVWDASHFRISAPDIEEAVGGA